MLTSHNKSQVDVSITEELSFYSVDKIYLLMCYLITHNLVHWLKVVISFINERNTYEQLFTVKHYTLYKRFRNVIFLYLIITEGGKIEHIKPHISNTLVNFVK